MSKTASPRATGKIKRKVASNQRLADRETSGSLRKATAFVQPKLEVGGANDHSEHEADAVADRVMSMGSPASLSKNEQASGPVLRRSGFRGLAAGIQRAYSTGSGHPQDAQAQREPLVQRRGGEGGFTASPQVTSNVNAMKSGGSPLPESTRSFLEPRFGSDLGHIRVHTDSRAANTADAIQAKAFTSGNHIAFNQGQFNPGSSDGMRLLAHEVTHTFQQGGGGVKAKRIQRQPVDVVQREPDERFSRLDFRKPRSLRVSLDPMTMSKHEIQTEIRLLKRWLFHNRLDRDFPRMQRAIQRMFRGLDVKTQSSRKRNVIRGINSQNEDGWVDGLDLSGNRIPLHDFMKVDVRYSGFNSKGEKREFFRIMEGPQRGKLAHAYSRLVEKKVWDGPARLVIEKGHTQRSGGVISISAKLHYGGAVANAVITVRRGTKPLVTGRTYKVAIPDHPHDGVGGAFDNVWFRIMGGPQGDEYLHKGAFSAGCITITSAWPPIYNYIINKRLDSKHIGTVKVTQK